MLIRITVKGKGVHGSTPWAGIDPLPPAAEIITAMGQVYRQLPGYDPLAITIGHVEDVGRFNVVGEQVQLLGTIRSTVEPDMDIARERAKRTAENVAEAYGATAEVEFLQPVPAVHNTKPWIDAVLPTLEHVVGHDHLVEAPPGLGYDDVSYFVNKYGGAYLQLGAQCGCTPTSRWITSPARSRSRNSTREQAAVLSRASGLPGGLVGRNLEDGDRHPDEQ